MKEKIKARLKELFPGVNLSNARLDAIADKLSTKITEEDQIDAKLKDLDEVLPFAEIAKQDDKVRTLEAKQKADPKKDDPDPKKDDPKKDEPVITDPAFKKQFDELAARLLKFEQKESLSKLQETLHKRLTDKKIPVALAKGRTIEKEEDLDALVAEIETDFTELKQGLVNEGLGTTSLPLGSDGRTDNVDTDIKEWAAKSAPATK